MARRISIRDWGQWLFQQTALGYYLYRLAGVLAPRISPALGYRLAERAGDLLYHLSPARVHVRDNMRHILGPEANPAEVECRVRLVFHYMVKNYYDLFRLPTLDAADIFSLVKVEGYEHLEAALARGKGVVLTSAHFGNIDVVSQYLAFRGVPVVCPVEHVRPEKLFQYLRNLRMSKGIRLIPVDGPLLELFRALRRGEVVGVVADRDPTNSGIVVDFFGAPARLPDGPVRLSLHSGAPLVAAFCNRLPDNSFFVRVEPPLELEKSGDRERDVQVGMEQVVRILERYIGERPEQWVLSVPVWV